MTRVRAPYVSSKPPILFKGGRSQCGKAEALTNQAQLRARGRLMMTCRAGEPFATPNPASILSSLAPFLYTRPSHNSKHNGHALPFLGLPSTPPPLATTAVTANLCLPALGRGGGGRGKASYPYPCRFQAPIPAASLWREISIVLRSNVTAGLGPGPSLPLRSQDNWGLETTWFVEDREFGHFFSVHDAAY